MNKELQEHIKKTLLFKNKYGNNSYYENTVKYFCELLNMNIIQNDLKIIDSNNLDLDTFFKGKIITRKFDMEYIFGYSFFGDSISIDSIEIKYLINNKNKLVFNKENPNQYLLIHSIISNPNFNEFVELFSKPFSFYESNDLSILLEDFSIIEKKEELYDSTIKSEEEIHERIIYLLQEKAKLFNINFVLDKDNPNKEYVLANNDTCFFIFRRRISNTNIIRHIGFLSSDENSKDIYKLTENSLYLYPKEEKDNELILDLLQLSYTTLTVSEAEQQLKERFNIAKESLFSILNQIPNAYKEIKVEDVTGLILEINKKFEIILTTYSLEYSVKSSSVNQDILDSAIYDKISILRIPLDKIPTKLSNLLQPVLIFMVHANEQPIKKIPTLIYDDDTLNRLTIINQFLKEIQQRNVKSNFMSTRFVPFNSSIHKNEVANHIFGEGHFNKTILTVLYFTENNQNFYQLILSNIHHSTNIKSNSLEEILSNIHFVFEQLDQF